MSQNERVLEYMRTHKGITALDAMRLPDDMVMRLAARISELREDGYTIDKEMEKTEKGKRYARYFLIREKE